MSMILAVACGGALGAVGRYLVSNFIETAAGYTFPWGTLAVNFLGCAILGILVSILSTVWAPSSEIRSFLTIGMMGGLTTFSAFSFEVVIMIERGDWLLALIYVGASVVLCVAAMACSMAGVRMFL